MSSWVYPTSETSIAIDVGSLDLYSIIAIGIWPNSTVTDTSKIYCLDGSPWLAEWLRYALGTYPEGDRPTTIHTGGWTRGYVPLVWAVQSDAAGNYIPVVVSNTTLTFNLDAYQHTDNVQAYFDTASLYHIEIQYLA